LSPRKINKAAMRRAREQLLAEAEQTQTPLPEAFTNWFLDEYQPTDPELRPLKAQFGPFVLNTLQASSIRGVESLRKHVTHLVHFAVWAIKQGLPLTRETLIRTNVDEYCRTGMPHTKTGKDRRSKLRKLADQINPDQAPTPSETIQRPSVKPPYTAAEVLNIKRVVYRQPTTERIRSMAICVGLGLGAGFDSPDIRPLTLDHATDLGDEGIRIDVPGTRARTVWVLREYEDMVRTGLLGLTPGQLLIGRSEDRTNIAGRVYSRAALYGNLPHLEQSRMRTTWLATLMSRPVPLAVILRAAGLRSTRTLFDILPHIPGIDSGEGAYLQGGSVR
jgi:hypothetical protein